MAYINSSFGFGEHMLSCSICYESLRCPKVLPCLHSFCQECIERHYEIYKLCNGGKLSCPTCRAIIPLPFNGVSGFRSDVTVERVRQLLHTLPDIKWKGVSIYNTSAEPEDVMMAEEDSGDETSDDEMPSRRREFVKPGADKVPLMNHDVGQMAVGGSLAVPTETIPDEPDEPENVKLRADLQKKQSVTQNAIANIRNKMLQLYHIENCLKTTIQNEIAEQLEKAEKGQKTGKKFQKKITIQVEEKHNPTLALLLKEQDKLYQKIVEAKAVHDVLEEVLDRTTVSQVSEVYEFSSNLQKKLWPVIKGDLESNSDNLFSELVLPAALIESVKTGMKEASHVSLLPSVRDPRKMGVQLLFKISGLGKEPGKFNFPTHATFHPNGDLIVSDKNNLRLQIFDKKGNLKQELFNETIKPRRARINPINNNLYVSDEMSESVKVFSPEGELISRVGEGYFLCPAGMDFDSRGNLIMTDPEKNYVSIHDTTSGKLLHKFFFRYMDDKKVPNPYYVAVNEDDQFIIADKRNGRIKVFASNGQLLFRINKLDCPRGVCVDPYGNILVAEGDRHCVSMYSAYGKFMQFLIDREEHGLCYPLSLDMDGHGRLAVTQCGYMSAHEVLVFQIC